MLYSKVGAGSAPGIGAKLDKYFTGAVSYYVSHPGNKTGMLFSGISGLMIFFFFCLKDAVQLTFNECPLFLHEHHFIFIH